MPGSPRPSSVRSRAWPRCAAGACVALAQDAGGERGGLLQQRALAALLREQTAIAGALRYVAEVRERDECVRAHERGRGCRPVAAALGAALEHELDDARHGVGVDPREAGQDADLHLVRQLAGVPGAEDLLGRPGAAAATEGWSASRPRATPANARVRMP